MPFQIIRNDITNMRVDAIVNTANRHPTVGTGTDYAIHEKAGPQLLEERRRIGYIPRGQSAISPAFGLDAKYVIHTVGPRWNGGDRGEELLLRSCYDSALRLAWENDCHSIAFPLISTGNYAFPRSRALQIAIRACGTFLQEREMDIYLVVFSEEAFRLSKKLSDSITSYIDRHYVEEKHLEEYGDPCPPYAFDEIDDPFLDILKLAFSYTAADTSTKADAFVTIEESLRDLDAGWSETLLRLIWASGKEEPEIYNKAFSNGKHFHKIRKDRNYRPTKQTAVAFALALELDLDTAQDLLGRAGYTLSNSSKFDLIIKYFIQHKNYDMFEINEVLAAFDQKTLGV